MKNKNYPVHKSANRLSYRIVS